MTHSHLEASSSSSVSSLPPVTSVCSMPLDAVAVFYDNIVKSRGVGIRSSVFSSDSNVLVNLIKLHGIECSPDLSVDQLQYIILRHLVVGDCFRSAEHNRTVPRGSRVSIVCSDMSIAFLHRVIDDISNDQKLTNRKLSALAAAFSRGSYSAQPFSARACQTRCYETLHVSS